MLYIFADGGYVCLILKTYTAMNHPYTSMKVHTAKIDIVNSIARINAAGFDTSWHSTKHTLPVQRERIAEFCRDCGIDPVYR